MPMNGQNGTTSSDTLNGWKEIASYFNRSVRAVQRWERELGLPVHRIKATDGQTVYGIRTEIDKWRRSRDLPKALPEDVEDSLDADPRAASENDNGVRVPSVQVQTTTRPERRWIAMSFAAIALVALGAVLSAFLVPGRTGPIESIQTAGTSVVAYDSFGRVVWSKNFGRQISRADGFTSKGDTWAMFVDLDGDGPVEAIIPLRFSSGGKPSAESDVLVAFDARGNVRWTLRPDFRIQCGSDVFEGPWRFYTVRASTTPGQRQRLWVAFNHSTWWPGVVMEVSATGHPTLKMLHTGWVADLTQWDTPSGRFLAVAGFNNERVRPTVSLIDIDAEASMSPHSEPRFSCEGAPQGMPNHVYLFPVLDTGIEANAFARSLTVLASALKIHVSNYHGDAIAQIGANLKVADFSMSDSYWAAHRYRETEGLLNHSVEACPLRSTPQPIEEWTSATAWRTSTIVPTVRQSESK